MGCSLFSGIQHVDVMQHKSYFSSPVSFYFSVITVQETEKHCNKLKILHKTIFTSLDSILGIKANLQLTALTVVSLSHAIVTGLKW